MKILWITNILFPDICKELHRTAPVTGGWMKSLADALLEQYPNIELAVAALYGANKKHLLEKKLVVLLITACHIMNTIHNIMRLWKRPGKKLQIVLIQT